MLKLKPNATFTATVPISIAGQKDPVEISIEFKHMSRKKLEEAYKKHANERPVDQMLILLREVVIGWTGVDAEFSADEFDQLLDDFPSAAETIFGVFRAELFEARRKN